MESSIHQMQLGNQGQEIRYHIVLRAWTIAAKPVGAQFDVQIEEVETEARSNVNRDHGDHKSPRCCELSDDLKPVRERQITELRKIFSW